MDLDPTWIRIDQTLSQSIRIHITELKSYDDLTTFTVIIVF